MVLAGGAAHGFAHIGVIRWLEEHRVPVDFVVGTSMGGLVGGLYASGMTPDELTKFVTGIDWERMFTSNPPYRSLSFRRKQDRRAFTNEIEIGLRHGIQFPAGVIAGEQVSLLLSNQLRGYSDQVDFDKLPIRFRCIAADLVKAEQVIFSHGSLPMALRATMSLPGIFTPVTVGNQVLADGGLLNNLPTDVARDQMPSKQDVILAVDFIPPQPSPETLQSLFGVAARTIAVMMLNSERQNMRLADLLLLPDVSPFGQTDYDKADELIQRGYDEAERRSRFLLPLALDQSEWDRYLAERRGRKQPHEFIPNFVAVEGIPEERAQPIQERLEKYVGKPLNSEAIDRDLLQINGTGRFSLATYERTTRDGQDGLLIRLVDKSYGPPFLNPGFDINGADVRDVSTVFNARVTMLDVGSPGSELRTDLTVGSRTGVGMEYFRRLGRSNWFVAPGVRYSRQTEVLAAGGLKLAQYAVDTVGGSLDAGYQFGVSSELRAGFDISRPDASVAIGSPDLERFRGLRTALRTRWVYDGQDRPTIPTRGIRWEMYGDWVFKTPGGTSGLPRLETSILAARPLSRRSFVAVRISGGSTLGKQAPFLEQFELGGPLRLGAFDIGELRGSHYFANAFGYFRQIAAMPSVLGGRVYAGGFYEMGDAFDDVERVNVHHNGSAGFFLETKLGVVFVGGSAGSGNTNLYFTLGRFF